MASVLLAIVLLTGCASRPAEVVVSPSSVSLGVGKTAQFSVEVRDARGNPLSAPLNWASSDSSVVLVSSGGQVVGLRPGTATVTVKAGNASGVATVFVADLPRIEVVGVEHGAVYSAAVTR